MRASPSLSSFVLAITLIVLPFAVAAAAAPAPAPVALYNFNGTDTTHMVKNGFAFEANSDVAVAPPGETEKGIPFTFQGVQTALDIETIAERRFTFNDQNQFYFHQRFFVPLNYKHRNILPVEVTGDISSWKVGDAIKAADGSTATIYAIVGQSVRLEFAVRGEYPDTWTANITNTTRSQVRAAVRTGASTNNKLAAFWCDGYSFKGQNPTVVFEARPVAGRYSSAYAKFSIDKQVAGADSGEFDDFITAAQLGKWMDVVYYAKLGSAVGVSDGQIGMWIKREGESSFTQKINLTNLPLWKRAGNNAGFREGYVHGAQNSGYFETTVLTDSLLAIYDQKPQSLTQKVGDLGWPAISLLLLSSDTPTVPVQTYSISATVSGLGSGKTVVLQNSNAQTLSFASNTNGTFATKLGSGTSYAVSVKTQPSGQTCTVSNGSGTIAGSNVTNVTVACVTNTYSISATVSGLGSGKTLVLQNSNADTLSFSTNTSKPFATKLTTGASYAVTVKTQPIDQTCTVSNGSGTIASSNVTNVTVACVNTSPVVAPVALYNFNGTDTTHMVKNGFAFEANSDVAVAPSGETEKGIPFTFQGVQTALDIETIAERRFTFNDQNQFYFHQRVFVPLNYKHRSILALDVTGDMSSWKAGDAIKAADGSTATVYAVVGQSLRVEFAVRGEYPDTWTANITNTTRSQVRAAVRVGASTNNKLMAFWCDGYSSTGQNPTVVFESRPVAGRYSMAYAKFSIDHQGGGSDMGEFEDFITAAQLGKWMDVIYYAKLGSAVGVSDGQIGMWIKREGESSFTQKINQTNLPLWKRAGNNAGFRAGYIHGAQNSGYFETTVLTDSLIAIYDQKPQSLTQNAASVSRRAIFSPRLNSDKSAVPAQSANISGTVSGLGSGNTLVLQKTSIF
ncbi:MAG: hypothetical protein V4805_19545 [Pseudomonadota bacterium]